MVVLSIFRRYDLTRQSMFISSTCQVLTNSSGQAVDVAMAKSQRFDAGDTTKGRQTVSKLPNVATIARRRPSARLGSLLN